MSKNKNNCCCNNYCATPVCGQLYQINPIQMAPVCAPVCGPMSNCCAPTAQICAPVAPMNRGCGSGCGSGLGGNNICTLLLFLLILGNTGLLENRNALTLILLFWCCFGLGNRGGCNSGCGGFGGFGGFGGGCGC